MTNPELNTQKNQEGLETLVSALISSNINVINALSLMDKRNKEVHETTKHLDETLRDFMKSTNEQKDDFDKKVVSLTENQTTLQKTVEQTKASMDRVSEKLDKFIEAVVSAEADEDVISTSEDLKELVSLMKESQIIEAMDGIIPILESTSSDIAKIATVANRTETKADSMQQTLATYGSRLNALDIKVAQAVTQPVLPETPDITNELEALARANEKLKLGKPQD